MGPEAATRFLKFVNASPTPFHAVHNAALRLEKAGFKKIREKEEWEKKIQPGGKYYFTRSDSLPSISRVCTTGLQKSVSLSCIHFASELETGCRSQHSCDSCGQPEPQGP